MESRSEVFHCDTESDLWTEKIACDGRESCVESATAVNLLTIIFWASVIEKMDWNTNFSVQSLKTAWPSVYGEAPILPDLLKNPAESKYLSVYGQSAHDLARLPVVRELGAIHQMLTVYCRITQTGSKETSTTITNTDDRYAQSLGSKTSLRYGALTTNS